MTFRRKSLKELVVNNPRRKARAKIEYYHHPATVYFRLMDILLQDSPKMYNFINRRVNRENLFKCHWHKETILKRFITKLLDNFSSLEDIRIIKNTESEMMYLFKKNYTTLY